VANDVGVKNLLHHIGHVILDDAARNRLLLTGCAVCAWADLLAVQVDGWCNLKLDALGLGGLLSTSNKLSELLGTVAVGVVAGKERKKTKSVLGTLLLGSSSGLGSLGGISLLVKTLHVLCTKAVLLRLLGSNVKSAAGNNIAALLTKKILDQNLTNLHRSLETELLDLVCSLDETGLGELLSQLHGDLATDGTLDGNSGGEHTTRINHLLLTEGSTARA